MSCVTNDSKEAQQKDSAALKATQAATTHKSNDSKTAKQEDLKVRESSRSPTTYEGKPWYYEAEETTLKGAQQAVIDAFGWDHVIIQMPGGALKEITGRADLYFTPQDCKKWDYKTFGKEYKVGDEEITHLWGKQESKTNTGVLPYAIKGLLKKAQGSNIVVIVSIGVREALGISQEAEDYLKKLEEEGKIGEYYILNSKEVPARHNACVKAGKKVYTLLHTTC
ncbi:MAG: hypothetical protein AAF963_00870 [Bacteroidota bacterium]